MDMDQLKQTFQEFMDQGEEPKSFFAPGRVNLIGEHTDYNGGNVFPCALSVGTYALARKRNDTKLRLYSLNFPDLGVIEADLHQLKYDKSRDWANYPIGVTEVFQKEGFSLETGFDVVYYGNIPNGAGLSSSASIEILTAVFLKSLFNLPVDMITMVQLAQKAENEFVGVNCGIMDQFAIAAGKKDHAVILDCDSLDYKHVPLKMSGLRLVIANTNKRRGLADSKYNERRQECEKALSLLQKEMDIQALGDVTNEQFEMHSHLIEDPVIRRRAKHAVYENNRTLSAVDLLEKGDMKAFGQLMNESHISLRDDYEVTGTELDALVEAAWREGAIGSRMTGAGFGGCTISIVKEDEIQTFTERVGKAYREVTDIEADFYTVEVGDGAKKMKEEEDIR
ncbi:galactokinase [Halobacillus campisalis]|uniref:Galactokinase n=1 Tax=Halobacillus campisalis TaxID=435909 RepID=A0ABW2K6I6_9BACI